MTEYEESLTAYVADQRSKNEHAWERLVTGINGNDPHPSVAPVLGEALINTAYGYAIDHVPVAARCCELHNVNCEPLGDLCCDDCAEVHHYRGLTHAPCVVDRCDCSSERQHLGTTRPGYAGDPIGMREPLEMT